MKESKAMKAFACCLLVVTSLPVIAQMSMPMDKPMAETATAADEKLGTVSFANTCSPAVQASFNRGIALLHDFWYDEANRQFKEIVKADPSCSMAHWGVAMSYFHQIWGRPDEEATKISWSELQKAQSPPAKSPREQGYIAALSDFFKPGSKDYQSRIEAYSDAMGVLHSKYPDVDTGAFYALSLLASGKPGDTSLANEHKAMAVLTPLFAKYPDNPGVDHYITHACDNPSLAKDGLAAADHYGEIAPSGAHAYHMPGHIYSRLGMWPQEIQSQLGSIAASEAAEARGQSGIMDEPHSYDFVIYAYLQSGQDKRAKWAMNQASAVLSRIATMPDNGTERMRTMVPRYRTKYPVFYALEMRDWTTASALEPVGDSSPEFATMTYWAKAVADGHLRRANEASADLANYDAQIEKLKKTKDAYLAEGTFNKIERDEIVAWVHYAKGMQDGAIQHMREAADLQDKVGQAEVDIPAREMLADMLLELHHPQQALAEYEVSLKLSPNRFNGLYNAGRAAEEAGDKAKAQQFYAALLKSTDNGAQSTRPEFAHVKSFVSSTQVAAR
jgi:tetratricopeptide (TPR) repeat protein